MGLSNDERFAHILWGIKRINALLPDLTYTGSQEDWKKLAPLVKKLWPTLLRSSGDGMCRITGSCMTKNTLSSNNPFHVAMLGHGSEVYGEIDKLLEEKQGKERFPADLRDAERKADYDFGSNYIPEMHQIIRHGEHGAFHHAVLLLYGELENLQYINRYQDKSSSSMKELSELIAEMIGVCFTIIADERIYFETYLIYQIMRRCLHGDWDSKTNLPFAITRKFNLQHRLHVWGRDTFQVAELMMIWKEIQFVELTTERRLIPLLRIAGKGFISYPLTREQLTPLICKHNHTFPTDKVSIKTVNECLAKVAEEVKVAKDLEESEFKRTREYCELTYHTDMSMDKINEAIHVNEEPANGVPR